MKLKEYAIPQYLQRLMQVGLDEDVSSIAQGITGDKGHVHISFGDVIQGGFETPEDLAAMLQFVFTLEHH